MSEYLFTCQNAPGALARRGLFDYFKNIFRYPFSFFRQRIMNPSSVFPALDQSRFLQFVQVVRHQILRQAKMLDDPAGAMFAALQNAKYFKPVFLGQ
jgi:hypothetical protein